VEIIDPVVIDFDGDSEDECDSDAKIECQSDESEEFL